MAVTDTRSSLRLPRTPQVERRPRTRGVLVLFAGGMLLLQLGWTVAFPPFWGMDETDHVFRASSVAAGHWQPATTPADRSVARGEIVRVRSDLVDRASGVCLEHSYSLPGNCLPLGAERDGTVPIASAAGRYNPLYYVVAGTISEPFQGTAALYAMRVTTAVWSCLLLTGALWALMTRARSRWPMAGLLLACTPTMLYSTAVAAPNGVHLAAAICLWCSVTSLLLRPGPSASTPRQLALGAWATTSAVTTLFTHTLGLLWVPLILVAAWGLAGCPPPRQVLRRVPVWVTSVIGAAYVAAGVWVVLARTNDPTAGPPVDAPSPWWYVGRGLFLWPLQAVAAFPDKQDGAPAIVYGIWILGVAALLFVARHQLRSHRSETVTLALVVLVSFAVPAALTLVTVERIGGAWQGRYGYPLAAGVILGLAMLIDRSPQFSQRAQRTLLLVVPALFVAANVVSQAQVVAKTSAVPGLVSVSSWNLPSVWLLVVCGLASAALLAAALARQPRTTA